MTWVLAVSLLGGRCEHGPLGSSAGLRAGSAPRSPGSPVPEAGPALGELPRALSTQGAVGLSLHDRAVKAFLRKLHPAFPSGLFCAVFHT